MERDCIFKLNYFEGDRRCHWDSDLKMRGSGTFRLKKNPISQFSPKSGKLCSQVRQNKTKQTEANKKSETKQTSNQNSKTKPKPQEANPPHKSNYKKLKRNKKIKNKREEEEKKINCAFWQQGFLSWMFFKVFAPASGKF